MAERLADTTCIECVMAWLLYGDGAGVGACTAARPCRGRSVSAGARPAVKYLLRAADKEEAENG